MLHSDSAFLVPVLPLYKQTVGLGFSVLGFGFRVEGLGFRASIPKP